MAEGWTRYAEERPYRVVYANAKVNPFLRVLWPRDDGYHDVETLVVPIALRDRVVVHPSASGGLLVYGKYAARVPPDEENLVLVTSRALADACGRDARVRILLFKRIPVAAGLGGGSADAAATLLALNQLWGCGLSDEKLSEIGASVGSDVPALLLGGRPALARGRGEVVEPVPFPSTDWVLVPAPFPVGTADAYRWWDEDGGVTGPDPFPLLDAAAEGDLEAVGRHLSNDLEGPVMARHPELQRTKERLLRAGALGAVLAGSGPTMAGLARDADHARRIAEAVEGAIVTSGPPAMG